MDRKTGIFLIFLSVFLLLENTFCGIAYAYTPIIVHNVNIFYTLLLGYCSFILIQNKYFRGRDLFLFLFTVWCVGDYVAYFALVNIIHPFVSTTFFEGLSDRGSSSEFQIYVTNSGTTERIFFNGKMGLYIVEFVSLWVILFSLVFTNGFFNCLGESQMVSREGRLQNMENYLIRNHSVIKKLLYTFGSINLGCLISLKIIGWWAYSKKMVLLDLFGSPYGIIAFTTVIFLIPNQYENLSFEVSIMFIILCIGGSVAGLYVIIANMVFNSDNDTRLCINNDHLTDLIEAETLFNTTTVGISYRPASVNDWIVASCAQFALQWILGIVYFLATILFISYISIIPLRS